MTPHIYTFEWRSITIELVYHPTKWGGVIAHLEIRTIDPKGAPLPITETGYLSHFHPVGSMEADGGDIVALVTEWLDKEAQKPEWITMDFNKRQGDLFD